MEGTAEELRIRASELHHEGVFDEALALASQALERAESALGTDHVDLILWLHVLLRCQFAAGAYDAGRATFERCQTLASHEPEPPLSFSGPLLTLADFCDSIGEHESALAAYKRVFKMCEQPPAYCLQTAEDVASVNACLAQALKGMGVASFHVGDPRYALQCLEKSQAFFEAAYGRDAPEMHDAVSRIQLIRASLSDQEGAQ